MANKFLCMLLGVILAGAVGSGCVIKEDPCSLVDCGYGGQCIETAGLAACECFNDYHPEDLYCFPNVYIDFDWNFGSRGVGCEEALVTGVRVRLLQGSTELVDDTLDCSFGGAQIGHTQDGSYTLELTGLGSGGEEFFGGVVDPVVVQGQTEGLGLLTLPASFTGDMMFSWVFDRTLLMDCVASGVYEVQIRVRDLSGNNLVSPATVNCLDAGASITNWEPGKYNLVLAGQCSDFSVGYLFDSNVEVSLSGANDYGDIALDNNGGCP